VFQKPDLGRIASKNSHASPTPVIDGDRVFVHFGAHGTACLTTDGRIVWRRELQYDHRHGPGGSPVVWNDLLIISCDGGDVQYVVALEKDSGRIRWKTDRVGQMAYCTPLLIRTEQGEQVVCNGGDAIVAYDPRSGRELWRCRHGGHSVVPRPVFSDGLVYFCSGYWTPTLYIVRPDGHGDVTDSHVVGTVRRGVPHNPSPLVVGNELYMVSDMGVLTALDAHSGEEIWRQRLGGSFSASPTYADGRIYLLNEDGTTTVIAAAREYRSLATNHVEGRTLASLAIADRSIFLRTDTHVYRIAEPSSVAALNVTADDRLVGEDGVLLEAGTAARGVRR
jgi:outer membrane protein assembly factor BamB